MWVVAVICGLLSSQGFMACNLHILKASETPLPLSQCAELAKPLLEMKLEELGIKEGLVQFYCSSSPEGREA